MKTIIPSLILVGLLFGLSGCVTTSPKALACQQACKSSLKNCKKSAKGDKAKLIACDATKQVCFNRCNQL